MLRKGTVGYSRGAMVMSVAGNRRKRIQAVVVLMLGLLLSLALILSFGRSAEKPVSQSLAVEVIGGVVLGGLALVVAAALYGVATLTHCLTFDYSKPVWRSFRRRFVLAHLLLQVLLTFAAAFLFSAMVTVVAAMLGANLDSWFVGLLLAAVVVLILSHTVNVWVPLDRSLLVKILTARGVAPAEIAGATYVGLSDPSRSSWRKGVIEDDIGGLWLGTGALIYRGDGESFYVPRGDIVAVERDVDPANVAAVTGAAHPVLVWRVGDKVRRSRLHAEGHWLVFRTANRLDTLAERIERWRTSPAEAPL